MPREQYQTVREVAERLKVSEATVRHWVRDGDLRAIDVGKSWRIADSDLEAFLTAHETRAREAAAEQAATEPVARNGGLA
jgi:excisionase family DNA binding protein